MKYKTSETPVVIFCGGRGIRLKEETEFIPKPLVKIGGQPILWHIMKIYHAQGFQKFVLLVGYKGEKIKEYFYRYPVYHSDFTVRINQNGHEILYHNQPKENWEITIIDTGIDTETGGRLKKAEWILKDKLFMLTYGDGVSNINLKELLEFHNNQKRIATVTGVYPPGRFRFGEIKVEGHLAVNFLEKPEVRTGFINGGFFVINPDIFKLLSDDKFLIFEKDILPELTKKSQLAVYPHYGYWSCMDTLRDMELLNEEWRNGNAEWKIWDS